DRYGDDPLSGKASTDTMGNSLEGKASPADRYGDDPLSGKASTDTMGNSLEGKASPADRHGDDPLSGKASTDSMGNPIDGKGSAADRYGDDPLSGKASTDAMGNPIDGKGSAADRYGDDPLSGKASTDAMGNPVDGKGSAADRYGDKPLSGKIKTDPVPGPLDPKSVPIDPVKKALALEKRPELDPSLKDKIEKAESMSDLLPNIEDLSPDEIKEELESQGLTEDLLEDLDLGQPLLEMEKAKEALDQLSPELQDLIKKAKTLEDIIPDLDELSSEELEERKKKLGLDDDILDDLNLGAPLLKEQEKKKALEQLPPELQSAAKSANSINDLIPDADQLTAEEFAERKRKLGIDDDILDALNLGAPVLPASLEDAKNYTIDNKKQDELEVGSTAELNDYFNSKKKEQERLQEIAKREGTSDYLEKEKAKKLARAAQANESAEEIGDYYNEKKRKAEELRKREEKLEKQYEARDASKKDALNKHQVDHGATQSISGEASAKQSAQEKEQELFDALGGGLTEGATGNFDKMIGEALEVKPEEKIEGEITGNKASDEVNTESGDISVVISQSTGSNNEINLICEFEDFYEDELVVKVPKGSFAFGVDTEVKAAVVLNYNGKKINVNGEGVVIEIESLNKQQETLIISLKNIEKEKYETFMTLYEERQESILDFMKLAKGY
ncbi:MAG: hypothetical protein CME65_04670, partial [Halobacteriovoraceae bacterium]|nr:hypothetical protein [Halobacteriovoraceae bacterium]